MTQRKRNRKAWTKWRRLISEQMRSGKSVAAFCREQKLRASHFYWWKKRLRENTAARFVEVQVAESLNVPGDSRIEVRLQNGRSLMVGRGFDAEHAGIAGGGGGSRVINCWKAGAHGSSFWPWAMSADNAVFPRPFTSLARYDHLDQNMRSGDLVRLDVGCEWDQYIGDLGRTVPVSGQYNEVPPTTGLLLRPGALAVATHQHALAVWEYHPFLK